MKLKGRIALGIGLSAAALGILGVRHCIRSMPEGRSMKECASCCSGDQRSDASS